MLREYLLPTFLRGCYASHTGVPNRNWCPTILCISYTGGKRVPISQTLQSKYISERLLELCFASETHSERLKKNNHKVNLVPSILSPFPSESNTGLDKHFCNSKAGLPREDPQLFQAVCRQAQEILERKGSLLSFLL